MEPAPHARRASLVRNIVAGIDPVVTANDPILGEWHAVDSMGASPIWTAMSGRKCYGRPFPLNSCATTRWVFGLEGQGIRLQQFASGSPEAAEPAVTDSFATWDGRPWADPYGPSFIGQLVQYWRFSPSLIIRLVLDNVVEGERLEWSALAPSRDGSMLAVSNWASDDPARQTLRVFNRAKEDTAGKAEETSPVALVTLPPQRLPPNAPIIGHWLKNAFSEAGETHPTSIRFACNDEGLLEEHRSDSSEQLWHQLDGRPHPVKGDTDQTARSQSCWIDAHLFAHILEKNGQRVITIYTLDDQYTRLSIVTWDAQNPSIRQSSVYSKEP